MAIFSIVFSYSDCGVNYNKCALVRASSIDSAKHKLVTRLLKLREGRSFAYFNISRISVSHYNFIFE